MNDESPSGTSDAPRNGIEDVPESDAASDPDATDGSPLAALVRALNVPRNVAVGLAAGVLLAAGAYAYRVFELAGPAVESRAFPVLGPGGYFLMLAFVLAVTVGMLVAALLTAGSAYRLVRRSNRESDRP